jgi:hypothetical protein
VVDVAGFGTVEVAVVVGGLVAAEVEGLGVDVEGESGETQPVGGAVGPLWPGMEIVPAQPKLLKSPWTVTEPPSVKL